MEVAGVVERVRIMWVGWREEGYVRQWEHRPPD